MKLKLKDFGMFENKELDFKSGLNVVTSDDNAKGKTTIRTAIEFILSGKAQDKDISDFIPAGSPKLTPSVLLSEWPVLSPINRTINPNMLAVSSKIMKINLRKSEDPIEELGIKRAVINFLCNGYNFFNLTTEQQYEILVDYLGKSSFNPSDYIEIPSDISAEVPKEMSVQDVDKWHSKFYEERTNNTRAINSCEDNIKQITTELNNLPEIKDDIDKQIRELEQKKEKYKPYKTKEDIDKVRDMFAKLNSSPLVVDFSKELEIELQEITKKGVENKAKIDQAQKFSGSCPFVSSIQCQSKEEIAKYIQSLVEENNKLRARGQELFLKKSEAIKQAEIQREKEKKELIDKISLLQNELDVENSEIAKFNEDVGKRNLDITNEISRLNASKELKGRVDKLNEILERNIDEKVKLEKRKDQLQTLLSIFGKDGIKSKIVKSGASSFIDDVNKFSSNFGFKFEVFSEPKFSLKINGKTSKMLSEAEKLMSSVSIQFAIAKLSKYNFLIVDRADCLDYSNLKKLCDTLAKEEVISIIAGTKLKDRITSECTVFSL